MQIELTHDQFLEAEKLSLGAFYPLKGFMDERDFSSSLSNGYLSNGEIFPIPIFLDLKDSTAKMAQKFSEVDLVYAGRKVGIMRPSGAYLWDKEKFCHQILGTNDARHPGVVHFHGLNEVLLGGEVEILVRPHFDFSKYELTPDETAIAFKRKGWTKIAGFQTRNVPHRAHEYLQRIALELVDGILIHPLIGKKKAGDYTTKAIISGYEALIDNYLPAKRVLLATLSTVMRYAGPREAVFHALVRRNYGCTHFIVGRDHAGVGNFYGKYAAHDYIAEFEKDLKIEILRLHGPFYCRKCDGIATEKTCSHSESAPELCTEISGTIVRKIIANNEDVDSRYMRREVVNALDKNNLFILG